MTFHYAAHIPGMGIGIISDSKAGSFLENAPDLKIPKTHRVSNFAVLSLAGNTALCEAVLTNACAEICRQDKFDEIAPKIQEAYQLAVQEGSKGQIEMLLASKTTEKQKPMKLIKYVRNPRKPSLIRLEDKDHYIIGPKSLLQLEQDLNSLLSENYRRTKGLKAIGERLIAKTSAISTPTEMPLGACFGSLFAEVQEIIDRDVHLKKLVNGPWTCIILPVDGPIKFLTSTMYNGAHSLSYSEF